MKLSKKKIRTIAIIVLCCLINGYFFRYEIARVFPYSKITSLNLTTEEKLEDFHYFYDVITSSVPMVDEYEQLYGISFRERKDYYEQIIASTNSDYEFFCAMVSIAQDVPGFHFGIVQPDAINGLKCINSREIQANREIMGYSEYWQKIQNEQTEEGVGYFPFEYIDGDYWLESSTDYPYEPQKVVSMNGIPVDEYIMQNLMLYNITYDGCHIKLVDQE